MNERIPIDRRVALHVVGGVVVAVGLAGMLAARRLGFTEAPGALVVGVSADFMWGKQFAFNPLGALVMTAVGAMTLATSATRSKAAAFGTAAFAIAVAVVSMLQLGQHDQMFASRAGNVALLIAVAATLVAIAATPATPAET